MAEEFDPFAHLRILTIEQFSKLISYVPQHIRRLERAGKFPKRRRIGPNRVGYLQKDIEAWLLSRPLIDPRPDESGSPISPA